MTKRECAIRLTLVLGVVMIVQSARQAASAYPGVVFLAQRGYRFGDAIQVVVDRSRRERRSQRRECGVHGDVQPRKEGGLFRHRHLPSRVVGGAEVKKAAECAYRVVTGIGERLGREHLIHGSRPPLVRLVDGECRFPCEETAFDHQITQFVLTSIDRCTRHSNEAAALPFGEDLDTTEVDESDSPVEAEAIVAGVGIGIEQVGVP